MMGGDYRKRKTISQVPISSINKGWITGYWQMTDGVGKRASSIDGGFRGSNKDGGTRQGNTVWKKNTFSVSLM